MRATIGEVLRILADKDLKQPSKANERRQLLEKVVGERFDYPEMSRRSMGAPWANLSEKDKEEFVSLFQTLLVNTYADKIESYSGEGVQYVTERNEKEYAEVRTKVLMGKTEIPLDYRLLHKGSEWREYVVDVIDRARRRYGLPVEPPREVRVLDGYQGAGRGEVRDEEFETVLRLARLEGLVFDPVYTAKAFGGVLDTLKRDPKAFGRRICFVHTGGVFSVFPYRSALSRLSDGDSLVNS